MLRFVLTGESIVSRRVGRRLGWGIEDEGSVRGELATGWALPKRADDILVRASHHQRSKDILGVKDGQFERWKGVL